MKKIEKMEEHFMPNTEVMQKKVNEVIDVVNELVEKEKKNAKNKSSK